MQIVIGVVPPILILDRICAFQRRSSENTYPEFVEPHITAKAQGGLSQDLAWLEGVEKAAAQTSRFMLSLGSPNTFGCHVAYLSVFSSEAMASLHQALVECANPSPEELEKYFERTGQFVFHLTLGTTDAGLGESDIQEVAAQSAVDLEGIPAFEVRFIRMYRQDQPDGRYIPFRDLPLGAPD